MNSLMKRHTMRVVWGLLLVCAVALLPLTPLSGAHAQDGPDPAAITPATINELALLETLPHHHREIWSAAFSPDGTLIATGDYDGVLRLWDARDPENGVPQVAHWDAHDLGLYALAFNPAGTSLASAGWDGAVRVWSLEGTPRFERVAEMWHGEPVYALAYEPTGAWLVSGGGYSANEVRVWDSSRNYDLMASPGDHYDWVTDVAFSPDGRYLVSASADGAWRLWDFSLGQPDTVIREHEAPIGEIAFSPNGVHMVTSSLDGTVKLWSPDSGELLQTLDAGGYVWDVAFSPGGSLIAVGARDGAVQFWDAETGELRRTVQAHTNWVNDVAFSPDGALLVTAGQDGEVKLWHVAGD